ncbi:MAG TPA: hypothetical protein PKJ98_18485 [Verrucomicrobiota bacterium]|nr:hypothetical protein [Verrucomicrobiota bacterium]
MTQVSRPCGAKRVHVLQGGAQHVLVEEGDGVEGLVLGAGGDIMALRQGDQGPFDVLLAGESAGHVSEGGDVAPQAMNVAGLGGERFVLPANDFPQFGDRFGGSHIRTSLYSIYEPAVV